MSFSRTRGEITYCDLYKVKPFFMFSLYVFSFVIPWKKQKYMFQVQEVFSVPTSSVTKTSFSNFVKIGLADGELIVDS